MERDPAGFIHIAADGVARSYAGSLHTKLRLGCTLTLHTGNGSVIDYAPLSNAQLTKMINRLPAAGAADKERLAGIYEGVNGYTINDRAQIFRPSTELRPVLTSAQNDEHDDASAREAKAPLEERHVQCESNVCFSEEDCPGHGCDICLAFIDGVGQCWHGDY